MTFNALPLHEVVTEPKVKGKIIYVNEEKGWGFINSPDVRFTRIFFHWTGLEQNTLHFTKIKKGMNVEFKLVQLEDPETKEMKHRAIKIKVLNATN